MSREQHILIVGGGIGGVALAVGLQRRGISCAVYEKASVFREIGSGVVIAPNGVKAVDALDPALGKTLREAATPAESDEPYPFLTHTGRVKFNFQAQDLTAKWGAPLVPIHRAELHALLRQPLSTEILIPNKSFLRFEQNSDQVTAYFEDGTSASGTLLVGADGLRSRVRAQLFGDVPPNYLGFTSIRGVVDLTKNPYPGGFLTGGPGIQIFTAQLSGSRLYWTATVNAKEGEWTRKSLEQAQQDLIAQVRDWHDPIPDMIRQTPLDHLVVTDIHDRPPLKTWSQGRVALMGDSAHPMSPFQGMGANMALEDAAVLTRLIAENPDPAVLFPHYEALRIARTAKVAADSRQMGMMGQIENPLGMWLRDQMMSVMMRWMDSEKQDSWMYRPQL